MNIHKLFKATTIARGVLDLSLFYYFTLSIHCIFLRDFCLIVLLIGQGNCAFVIDLLVYLYQYIFIVLYLMQDIN